MIEQELLNHGTIVYTTRGVSMRPLLRQDQDLIVVDKRPEERLKRFDVALFKRDNGAYVLHRVIRVRERDYIICGDNLTQMEPVREDQILGVMRQVVRDGKTITVDSVGYQVYVHFWWGIYPIRFLLRRARHFAGKIKRKLVKS